jgi:hypothetical protein
MRRRWGRIIRKYMAAPMRPKKTSVKTKLPPVFSAESAVLWTYDKRDMKVLRTGETTSEMLLPSPVEPG